MLYIAATPIGNLRDVSFRFIETLASSALVGVESTQAYGTLKKYIQEAFQIQFVPEQKVVHINKDNEFEKVHSFIENIHDDTKAMYLAEAGTPLVSDPGFLLVQEAIKRDIPFEVLPGPSAPVTALLYSGFNPKNWMFIGFLPKKPGDIKRKIEEIKALKAVTPDLIVIFFESPHRIHKTLAVLAEQYPEAKLSISREMTKKFEETVRGQAPELMNREYKGEITVCLQ